MTTNTTKTAIIAGLFAVLMIPILGMQEADAAIASPVFDGLSTGLVVTWSGTVAHDTSNWEYGNQMNMCGQQFVASGFYDTNSNKRGASHQVPATINGICNIDRDLSGYVNLTLDKVEYSLSGDGNTSISNHNMGSGTSNYKFWQDAFSNSGKEYVTVKATYKHTN